jgi:hypothetical protein
MSKLMMNPFLFAAITSTLLLLAAPPAGAASSVAARIALEYQQALITGDTTKIEAAWKKLHTNQDAIQVLKETAPTAHAQYTDYTNKVTEGKRMRLEDPEGTKARRVEAAQQRIQERHPTLGADDELAKAIEGVGAEAAGGPKATQQQKSLSVKQSEYVESRRFAGGEEVVSDQAWRAHKELTDSVVQEAQGEAVRARGGVPGKQTASLPEGEIPKPKGDHDLYFDTKEPAQRAAGDPDRLTSELQEQLQKDTRQNMNKYVESGGVEPITEEGFTRKKIDNLPADVEKVGRTGSAAEFQELAETANSRNMEMYTCKSAVECEQKLRKMKEGRVDLETQGKYGAEQQRQAEHHKNLGDRHREEFVKGKEAPVTPTAADDQLFNATEVDAEGSKVAKHLDREQGSRQRAAADIEAEFGQRIETPAPEVSKELSESVQTAKRRTSQAEVEWDAARSSSFKDHLSEADARATAKFHAEAANKVPELTAEAQRGTAARSQPLNASQRGEMLETARAVGGEEYAEGVRKEMIEMERQNQAAGTSKHAPKVDPKAAAEARAGTLGKSSSSYVDAAAKDKAVAEGASGMLSDATGRAADAMREAGVRVPTQGQVMEGLGKGMDATMVAGMAAHGIQKERQEAAEEGRDFSTVNAVANATVRDSYEAAKQVATEELNKAALAGEGKEVAAARIAGRTADGLSGYSENKSKFEEEAMIQLEQAQQEGRDLTLSDEAAYRTRATVRSLPLHDMTEDLIAEEMQREVNEYGADASPAMAKARAAARVPFEALHAQEVFEIPYTDDDAEHQAGEVTRALKDRRETAILELDDGIHELTSIETKLNNLASNPNQDDPWVQQRRQELLDQYETKRAEMQRTNSALGKDAGMDDGEYIAIRQTVALLPQQPRTIAPEEATGTQTRFVDDGLLGDPEEILEPDDGVIYEPQKRFVDDGLLGPQKRFVDDGLLGDPPDGQQKRFVDDGLLGDPEEEVDVAQDVIYEPQKRYVDDGLLGPADEVVDPLANAMVANQPQAAEQALWQDQSGSGWTDPASQLARTFTGTNAAGESEADRIANTRTSLTTSTVRAQDIQEEQRRKAAQLDQAEDRKRQQQGLDASKFSSDWDSTIMGINVALSDLNQQDAIKVQQMTEAAIKLIQQMQMGAPNDAEFTARMNQLQREADRLTAQGQQGWTNIRNQLMGGPGGGPGNMPMGGAADPCSNDFTMNANMEMGCKCPGYSFDMSSARCVGGGGAGGGDPVATILSSVPPDQIDTRTVTCNSASKSGGDSPASITVDVGNSVGTAQVSYDLEWVKDRLLVQYGGATIYDTGCARGSAVIPVALNGSGSQIHVVVQPACEESGTSWSFSVSCP